MTPQWLSFLQNIWKTLESWLASPTHKPTQKQSHSITISADREDNNPVISDYHSPSLIMSPRSAKQINECLQRMTTEYGTMHFWHEGTALHIHSGRDNQKNFRCRVTHLPKRERTLMTLLAEPNITSSESMEVFVVSSFRGHATETVPLNQTVSAIVAEATAVYFLEHGSISIASEWQTVQFSERDWFLRSFNLYYDTSQGAVHDVAPSVSAIREQLANIDGEERYYLSWDSSEGDFSACGIVERQGRNVHEHADFVVDHLHTTWREASSYGWNEWEMVNPQFNTLSADGKLQIPQWYDLVSDDSDYEESEETFDTSFVLDNGQWDPCHPDKAVPKSQVIAAAEHLIAHQYLPNGTLWTHGTRTSSRTKEPDFKPVILIHNEHGTLHYPIVTEAQISSVLAKMDGQTHHRVILRGHRSRLFIHATNRPGRVMLTIYENHRRALRRYRLVDRLVYHHSDIITAYYAPAREQTIPVSESIPLAVAEKLAHQYAKRGLLHDVPLHYAWWRVDWDVRARTLKAAH